MKIWQEVKEFFVRSADKDMSDGEMDTLVDQLASTLPAHQVITANSYPYCANCGALIPEEAEVPCAKREIKPIGDLILEVSIRAILAKHFGGGQWNDTRYRFTPAGKELAQLFNSIKTVQRGE